LRHQVSFLGVYGVSPMN